MIVIQGIAIRFGQWGNATEHCPPMMARAGCFSLAKSTAFRFDHDPAKNFASTRTGDLTVWQTEAGVFFEARLDWSRRSAGLVAMVRSGLLRAASVRFSDDRESIFHQDGREEVLHSDLVEISLVHAAAQDGTACWLQDENPAALPRDLRHARDAWARAVAMAAVDRTLAAPRPAACARARR
jgi:phage head maturation protease